jgi:hypothetical protein
VRDWAEDAPDPNGLSSRRRHAWKNVNRRRNKRQLNGKWALQTSKEGLLAYDGAIFIAGLTHKGTIASVAGLKKSGSAWREKLFPIER